jgi:ethanolamine transporter EutH
MTKKVVKKQKKEADSVYFLKLVLFFVLGVIWIRPRNGLLLGSLPGIPIGLLAGMLFASHDHFQIDRKIEFAILLFASILSFIAPVGAVIFI